MPPGRTPLQGLEAATFIFLRRLPSTGWRRITVICRASLAQATALLLDMESQDSGDTSHPGDLLRETPSKAERGGI